MAQFGGSLLIVEEVRDDILRLLVRVLVLLRSREVCVVHILGRVPVER